MNRKQEKDEYLEVLWCMSEKEQDSMDDLKSILGDSFDAGIIDEFLSEGLITLSEKNKIVLTEKGIIPARQIIRAHRIAERLIYDVLGGKFESGACEFEHILANELTDSICVLLGHPRECPHGMPIPLGECCKQSISIMKSSVLPLTELDARQSARVAYVNGKNDPRFYKTGLLQIRPGARIRVLQKYPCHVIECEGGNIAIDSEVASCISVWRRPEQFHSLSEGAVEPARGRGKGRGKGWGLRLRRRRREGV